MVSCRVKSFPQGEPPTQVVWQSCQESNDYRRFIRPLCFVFSRCAYSCAPSIRLYLTLLNYCAAWLAAEPKTYVRNRLHAALSNVQSRFGSWSMVSRYHSSATPSSELYTTNNRTSSLSGPHIRFSWKYISRWSNHLVKIPLSF